MLNLIEHLPTDSHYIAALAEDPEAAEHMDPDAKPKPPRLTEFGPDIAALSVIADRLGLLIRVTRAAAGEKRPPAMQPYPRPRLAIDRLRHQRRLARHDHIKRQLLPGG